MTVRMVTRLLHPMPELMHCWRWSFLDCPMTCIMLEGSTAYILKE